MMSNLVNDLRNGNVCAVYQTVQDIADDETTITPEDVFSELIRLNETGILAMALVTLIQSRCGEAEVGRILADMIEDSINNV